MLHSDRFICRATIPKARRDMFVDDSCKMSPGAGSGACPRCALAAGRAGRTGAGGIPALRDREGCLLRGRGLLLCRRGSSPPESLLCPGAAHLPLPHLSCLAAGRGARARGSAGAGKGLGFPRLISSPASPHPCPWGSPPGAKSRVLRERMLPALGPACRSAPVRLRFRQGGVGPGRASGLPFRAAAAGAWGQKERADTLRGSSDQAVGELPPRNSTGASRSWCKAV